MCIFLILYLKKEADDKDVEVVDVWPISDDSTDLQVVTPASKFLGKPILSQPLAESVKHVPCNRLSSKTVHLLDTPTTKTFGVEKLLSEANRLMNVKADAKLGSQEQPWCVSPAINDIQGKKIEDQIPRRQIRRRHRLATQSQIKTNSQVSLPDAVRCTSCGTAST